MKKLSALVLALALGLSASPLVAAQDYDPSELYQQFLQQLQNPNQETPPPAETSDPGAQPQAEGTNPPAQPVRVSNPGPLTHEREVSITGKLIEGNSFHLIVDAVSANAQQGGNYFKQFIPGDTTSWYKKDLLVYTHNEDMVKKVIRAAKNYHRPTVRLTGWGAFIPSQKDPNLRLLASITLDPVLTSKASLENLSNPNDPEFKEIYKPSLGTKFNYSDYYGTISLTAGRAYMDFTDRSGNPLFAENGLQDRAIMYNEESDTNKWFEPYNIWKVDTNDLLHRYLVRARAERFQIRDVKSIRYNTLDVVDILSKTQVDQPVREAAPVPQVEAPQLEVQVPTKWRINYRLSQIVDNECFHPEPDFDVSVTYDRLNYTMDFSAGIGYALDFSGSVENDQLGFGSGSGTFAGFSVDAAYQPFDRVSIGSGFNLPGGCPIDYSTSSTLDSPLNFGLQYAIEF